MNYYQILGVVQGADLVTIKGAYRKLAMKYHPDRNPGNKAAEEMFKKVSTAYTELKKGNAGPATDGVVRNYGPVNYDVSLSMRDIESGRSFTLPNGRFCHLPDGVTDGSTVKVTPWVTVTCYVENTYKGSTRTYTRKDQFDLHIEYTVKNRNDLKEGKHVYLYDHPSWRLSNSSFALNPNIADGKVWKLEKHGLKRNQIYGGGRGDLYIKFSVPPPVWKRLHKIKTWSPMESFSIIAFGTLLITLASMLTLYLRLH